MKARTCKLMSAILTLTMILCLFTAMPITATAASVACRIVETGVDYAQLSEAVSAANAGATITLMANIDEDSWGDMSVVGGSGKTLTVDMKGYSMSLNTAAITLQNGASLSLINGKDISAKYIGVSGGNLTISATSVSTLYGISVTSGTASITADIYATEGDAISAEGSNSIVTVNGNLVLTHQNAHWNGYYAVRADQGARVTVTGNLTVNDPAPIAYDGEFQSFKSSGAGVFSGSKVTITGDIFAPMSLITNADVTVNGNLTSEGGSIYANGGKTTINGDIFVGSASAPSADIAMLVCDSEITINGTINMVSLSDTYIHIIDVETPNKLYISDLINDSNTSKPGYRGYASYSSMVRYSVIWLKIPTIDTVELTMHVPVAGEKMSLDGISVLPANSQAFLDQWIDVSAGKIMSGTATYEAGKTYACFGIVYPPEGYSFADKITFTVNGKAVKEYTHNDGGIDFRFDFVIGAEGTFKDVTKGDWYYNAVEYVFKTKLMIGTSADEFSPSSTLTRAMIATILYRNAGEPDVSALANPFNDVGAGQWYTDAVKWAADRGIVKGYGDGNFGTDRKSTRLNSSH